jgi:D-beta-D-heptose 7-phosphate kinase/D-beta-D-heptose 1-phosphate adenosyltransferase
MKHIGIVSGFFNPIHKGHIEYINASKKLCDYLVCVVNNDVQVEVKGSKKFMDETHRLFILQNIKSVDEGILAIDTEYKCTNTLELIRTKYPTEFLTFFNSGDVTLDTWDPSELSFCKDNKINIQIIDLPKNYSSSDLKQLC